MLTWLLFVLCGAIVVVTGVNLLASVTSLPELFTGLSSVAIFAVPEIAAGDVLGSCMFNILIIALLDAISRATPITTRVYQGQILSAAFGILALGLVGIAILAAPSLPAIGWMGVASIAFFVVYLLAMRTVFIYEQRRIGAFVEAVAETLNYQHVATRRAYGLFGLNAVLVVGAASYLPGLSAELAAMTGLGQSFFGTEFVALVTSLPEVVVAIAALRLGAVDMAVGNIFGSNLFNVGLILALDDLFYTPGPLLARITSDHAITAVAAMLMTAIAVIGLVYRKEKKSFLVAWDALGIVAVYLLTTALLFQLRG